MELSNDMYSMHCLFLYGNAQNKLLVAKVRYPVWPTVSLGETPLLNNATSCWEAETCLDASPLSELPFSSTAFPKSGICRLTVRTSYIRRRISRVLNSVKPCSSRARHVLCTCSIQGEKEQTLPPVTQRGKYYMVILRLKTFHVIKASKLSLPAALYAFPRKKGLNL